MMMITSAAGSPIARSWKSIPARRMPPAFVPGSASSSASVSELIIRYPTMINAAAVAWAGTIPISGAMKMNGRNSAPAITATHPVRPPAPTPAPDSM